MDIQVQAIRIQSDGDPLIDTILGNLYGNTVCSTLQTKNNSEKPAHNIIFYLRKP